MTRARVRWHTTVVTDWDAVIELDDDVTTIDGLDGNSAVLVAYEDQIDAATGGGYDIAEFTREIDDVEVLNP